MTSTTVAEFANELKKSPETLLEQLRAAGVSKDSDRDPISESDKQRLLGYLKASHGSTGERKKITLVKKSTSEIKQADATGKARTIQVEVRKKRTLIKRDDEPASAAPEAATEPAIDHAELARREEEARRQAELIRRQEEELAEKRRLREAQEAQQRAAAEAEAQQAEALAQAAEAAKPVLSREEREQLARAEAASINASQAKPAAPAAPVVSAQETAAAQAAVKAKADQAAREEAASKAAAESKARADEETARARDLDERRRKALAEAASAAEKQQSDKAATQHMLPLRPLFSSSLLLCCFAALSFF